MANIMSLKSVQNHVHRNGFDLSFRNSFTSKVGELLPVMCQEVIPGDDFSIDLNSMVRTEPVKTAALTRIKEYYDFYFVPTSLLWDKFDNYIIQTNNYNHSRNFTAPPERFTSHPYFTGSDLYRLLSALYQHRGDSNGSRDRLGNVLGYSAFDTTCKLLEYLGYGDWKKYFDGSYTYNAGSIGSPNLKNRVFPDSANLSYNPFPLLGYQKICNDYFRYSVWQTSRPQLFNLDYVLSNSLLKLPIATAYTGSLLSSFETNNTIFSLQYANYRKDLFTGVLPQAQFGATAMAAPLFGRQRLDFSAINPVDSNDLSKGFIGDVSTDSHYEANGSYSLGQGLGVSIFALRFCEATQKYREITQSGNLDFKTQLEKHWNVHVSDYKSYMCQWLGGMDDVIAINEVTNQNLASEESQAVLAGKGFNTSSKNGVVHFKSNDQYGYLYCIYHAEPVLDWTSAGCERHNLKVTATDYAIPEFDNIGMEVVPTALLANTPVESSSGFGTSSTFTLPDPASSLGYAPRYFDYKMNLDVVRGAYLTTKKDWVSPLRVGFFANIGPEKLPGSDPSRVLPKASLYYKSFLINPACVNSIFLAQADGLIDSDVLQNTAYFNCHVVRNLSVDGLPY